MAVIIILCSSFYTYHAFHTYPFFIGHFFSPFRFWFSHLCEISCFYICLSLSVSVSGREADRQGARREAGIGREGESSIHWLVLPIIDCQNNYQLMRCTWMLVFYYRYIFGMLINEHHIQTRNHQFKLAFHSDGIGQVLRWTKTGVNMT